MVIFACMLAFTEYRSGAQFRSIQANFLHDLSLTWVDRSCGEECRVTSIIGSYFNKKEEKKSSAGEKIHPCLISLSGFSVEVWFSSDPNIFIYYLMLLKGHLWRNPLVGHKRLRGGIQPWWAPTSGSPAADGRYPTMVSTHQRVTSGWWSASDHGGYPPAADGRHPTMASIPLRAEGHPTFGPLEIRFAKTLSGLLCHPLVARRICCWRPESGWKDVCPQGICRSFWTLYLETLKTIS